MESARYAEAFYAQPGSALPPPPHSLQAHLRKVGPLAWVDVLQLWADVSPEVRQASLEGNFRLGIWPAAISRHPEGRWTLAGAEKVPADRMLYPPEKTTGIPGSLTQGTWNEQAMIYGLCLTGYLALGGRLPYQWREAGLAGEVGRMCVPLVSLPAVPAGLWGSIARGTHRDVRRRYCDLESWGGDLQAFLSRYPDPATESLRDQLERGFFH
ncbi:MAG: hypothetical protein D6722_25225 [Bacteroidetes bacterium]|nr:MAG: hypothetical protein D6722_25225 [Bacteroidota bacterium]